ncbi:ABC transporter ATP-binding protein [Fictibacillus norfolkensis]|uniref:ABC transporter ATP-binding protein n=1 Tax=Fictibacillus norfolkensis TaxID=2762233 RepID=A0ABR8SNJ6_9BACL|nr:ABC transporter ATP-binding protein [Fictibacillus norfolkensis]MBD7965073.1 ABC transporter ATP-binding protein [Fictibacillus norfolkensis]
MENVIIVQSLNKSYGTKKAVNNLSFSVKKGEIFGIIGPNGAGKTTTIEIMEGLRKKDSGEVSILGMNPEKDRKVLNHRIGVQFQATSIQKKMKVKEALKLFAAIYNKSNTGDEMLKLLGLEEKMDTYFDDLSGGQKQRLTLALATLHEPEIIFLDEPSMGLDPHARREMWNIIRSLRDNGTTIVVTTHYMEEAEKLCDRVAMIYNGELRALDEPSRLVEDISAHFISFRSPDFPLAQLHQMAGVIKVEHDEELDAFKLYTEDLQSCSYLLFKIAQEENYHISDYKFERGTLDDLFVHYLQGGESA